MFKDILETKLSIGKFIAIAYHKGMWREVFSHEIGKFKFRDHLEFITNIDSIYHINDSKLEDLNTFDFIIPVLSDGKIISYVIIADIDDDIIGMSASIKHMKFIQTLSNIVLVALENRSKLRDLINIKLLDKEMRLASQIQKLLIPTDKQILSNENIEADGFYKPYKYIGGDYFDIFELDAKNYGFCIADVSGKGIPAALIMSNFQAALRAYFTADIELEELLSILNKFVNRFSDSDKFISIFLGKYNFSKRKLSYLNAGHNPAILKNQETIKHLCKGSIGLGMMEELPNIELGEEIISPNSILFGYTDGLIEVRKDDKISFCEDLILEKIQNNSTIFDIETSIFDYINSLESEKAILDDISFLCIKFK
jgi:sigma-B regulation protein RsbU (phosphoserine phosphatase)